jgi:hypothetical protein
MHLYLFDLKDVTLNASTTYYLRTKVVSGAPVRHWGGARLFYGGCTIPESQIINARHRVKVNVTNGHNFFNNGDFITTPFTLSTEATVKFAVMNCLDDNNQDAGQESFEVAITTDCAGTNILTSARITDDFKRDNSSYGACDGHKYSFDFLDIVLQPGTYYLRTKALSGIEVGGPIRTWAGAYVYYADWRNVSWLKTDDMSAGSPSDVDKSAHGHGSTYTCWLATAANMLAGAGYGTGSTMQARADNIYNQLVAHFGTGSGWMDTALTWWLKSTHNPWNNKYLVVGLRGSTLKYPWRPADGAWYIGNELRKCNFVGLSISWPKTSLYGSATGGHAFTCWGDERYTDDNAGAYLTDNPAKVKTADSDRDTDTTGGNIQTYKYDNYLSPNPGKFNHGKGWYINYNNNHPFIKHIATLQQAEYYNDGDTYTRIRKVTGSYKTQKKGVVPDATDLHYDVGTDNVKILRYETDIDWDANSVPTVTNVGSPITQISVDWDLSENPVPYNTWVTITTHFILADDSGVRYKNVNFPGIYANYPDFGFDMSSISLGDPNDPNICGGYVVGAFDVVDGPNVTEVRMVYEYDYDQDPEHHTFRLLGDLDETQIYQAENFRFGHMYGEPDSNELWTFDEWMSDFPGPYMLEPTSVIELELNWDGMLPYPEGETYEAQYSPPPRAFTATQNLEGVFESDAAWGDFDGDGDLDLVICGKDASSTPITKTYENQNGSFVEKAQANLPGIYGVGSGALAWGDYDGDGDLDLAMAGQGDSNIITRIYGNNGTGMLTWDPCQVLTPVNSAALAWGDYDNDGDLDLVVTGYDGAQSNSRLYENDPLGTLTYQPAVPLTGLRGGSADWADYDGDTDFDLVLTGYDGNTRRIIFYENNPLGTLDNDGNHALPGVNLSDIAFGDYDNDGDLDLALTGCTNVGTHATRIYENDGNGVFSQAAAGFMDVYRSSCSWGDYDNDGDLDVAFCGYTGTSLHTRLYQNTGSGFTFDSYSFPGVREGSLTWADTNSNGNLDLFMTGADWSTNYARLYSNTGGIANSAPSIPSNLECAPDANGGGILFAWDQASDNETPDTGLYYVLRIGSSPSTHDIVSGTQASPLMGNRGQTNELLVALLPGSYYWSVKSVDAGLRDSDWAIEAECHHCPGDFDDDHDVELLDFSILANAWLADVNDGNWNIDCDISIPKDNVIDHKDLDIFTENWLLNR